MNIDLSDDIIGEILLCLPDKSAVRCKILSKKWHDFISLNKPIPWLVGFFCTKKLCCDQDNNVPNNLRFLPTSTQGRRIFNPLEETERLQLVSPEDESLSFLGHVSPHILGSSNGLLLCSKEEFFPKTYFVCNPINKQWMALPIPKTQNRRRVYHGFISSGAYTCSDIMHSYKAVRAINSGPSSNTLTIEIFSSSESLTEWKVFNLNLGALCYIRLFSVVVTENGVIYLVAVKYNMQFIQHADSILVFDQREQEQCLKFLEFPTGLCRRGCLGVADGLIRYAHYSLGQLTIWLLSENDNVTREWTPTHKVSIEFAMTTYPGLIHCFNDDFLEILAIHPLNPKIVFLGDSTKKLVFYVQDSKLELLCHNSELAHGKLHQIIPYTYALTSPRLFLNS
ncbi:hypothetical protein ACHQM5_006851 [Ranunculus cassubicifolius]